MQRACLTELQSLARRRAEGARAAVDRDGREVLINVCREGDIQLSGETCVPYHLIAPVSPCLTVVGGGRGGRDFVVRLRTTQMVPKRI